MSVEFVRQHMEAVGTVERGVTETQTPTLLLLLVLVQHRQSIRYHWLATMAKFIP